MSMASEERCASLCEIPGDRPSLVGPIVAASDCDACPLAEARHVDSGEAIVCVCGRVYADDGWTWPTRPSCVVDLAPPVRELAHAIVGARALRQYVHEEFQRVRPPRPSITPHARLLAEANGAQTDATDAEVQALARLLVNPTTTYGMRRWRDFMAIMLRQNEDLPAPDTEPVAPAEGQRLAARLESMNEHSARVLRALGRRCGLSTSWEEAVAVVADELLPPLKVSTYTAPGRPRVDRASVPPEVQREAEAEAMLAAAVRAWGAG